MNFKETINVSVIVPCYNTADYVLETLKSVSNQTYKNLEIIIVDDGSTDETAKIIEYYKSIEPRAKSIRISNSGLSNARMAGYKFSTGGGYLLFLDSDDIIDPTYIEKCIGVAEKGYDIVYSKACFFDAKNGPWKLPAFQLLDFLCFNCIYASALIRKSLFNSVGGYDPDIKLMEDWDCYINMIKHGGKVYRISEELFFYRKRKNGSSLTDRQTNTQMEESFLKIYLKHYDFYKDHNLGFKELIWRMHKHRINWFRRVWYKLFRRKKYLKEYEGDNEF